jgi:hypothetical protein
MHKAYGARVIYDGLNLSIRRRERWAVMGVNGAGKSTLLKLIAGETTPDEGTVTLGPSVKLGYFAQHAMELLDPGAHRLRTLEESFPLANVGSLKTLAGCFGFSGGDADKTCRRAVGRRKGARRTGQILYARPNFLVLDEPTNTSTSLQKDMIVRSLNDYEGTMLFVSHDRQFLARPVQPRARAGARRPHPVRRRLHRICRAEAATKRLACGKFPAKPATKRKGPMHVAKRIASLVVATAVAGCCAERQGRRQGGDGAAEGPQSERHSRLRDGDFDKTRSQLQEAIDAREGQRPAANRIMAQIYILFGVLKINEHKDTTRASLLREGDRHQPGGQDPADDGHQGGQGGVREGGGRRPSTHRRLTEAAPGAQEASEEGGEKEARRRGPTQEKRGGGKAAAAAAAERKKQAEAERKQAAAERKRPTPTARAGRRPGADQGRREPAEGGQGQLQREKQERERCCPTRRAT